MKRESSSLRTVLAQTAALAALLSIAMMSNSCADMPAAPTTPPPNSIVVPEVTVPDNVLTGVVLVNGRPVANAGVEFRVSDPTLWAHTTWASTMTDSEGRYRWEVGLPSGTIWLTGYAPRGASQPCAVSYERDGSNAGKRIDIPLTDKIGPSSLTVVPTLERRIVSGTVYEMTDSGRQPVQGAFVTWDILPDISTAWTATDSAGRFALCELPETLNLWMVFSKGRLSGVASLGAGADDVDIEVNLKP